jgi:hypothetical protein
MTLTKDLPSTKSKGIHSLHISHVSNRELEAIEHVLQSNNNWKNPEVEARKIVDNPYDEAE